MEPTAAAPPTPPMEVVHPIAQTLPAVLASPHSGTAYSVDFLGQTHLPLDTLRRSEDAFVDTLFATAARQGVPMVKALFPRSFVDPNREPYEVDPTMFDGPVPAQANTRSPRVAAGLGTVPRVAFDGQPIYRRRLPVAELERRIAWYYRPYHAALVRLIEETQERFGHCVLLDCHSMPSGSPGGGAPATAGRVDFVLGDNHGAACAGVLTQMAEAWLRQRGYRVVRNQPYAGGYTTQHYGAPGRGVHALQIEINRALYMDEVAMTPHAGVEKLSRDLAELVEDVCHATLGHSAFTQRAPRAAE